MELVWYSQIVRLSGTVCAGVSGQTWRPHGPAARWTKCWRCIMSWVPLSRWTAMPVSRERAGIGDDFRVVALVCVSSERPLIAAWTLLAGTASEKGYVRTVAGHKVMCIVDVAGVGDLSNWSSFREAAAGYEQPEATLWGRLIHQGAPRRRSQRTLPWSTPVRGRMASLPCRRTGRAGTSKMILFAS